MPITIHPVNPRSPGFFRLLLCAALLSTAPLAFAKSRPKSDSAETDYKSQAKEKVSIPTTKRDVHQSTKNELYNKAGIPKEQRKNYVIDHKIPLELGGTNEKSNLQVQTKEAGQRKDLLENQLTRDVKTGKITLHQAQEKIQQAPTK